MNSDLGAANTRAAIRRGQRRRMAYYTDYGLRAGLTPLQAARLAAECERWFLSGVHMSTERLAAECDLMKRKAA
jgi:hypothetical protein